MKFQGTFKHLSSPYYQSYKRERSKARRLAESTGKTHMVHWSKQSKRFIVSSMSPSSANNCADWKLTYAGLGGCWLTKPNLKFSSFHDPTVHINHVYASIQCVPILVRDQP